MTLYKKTILFAVNVMHSKALAAFFRAAGITTEHLGGEMESRKNRGRLGRVAAVSILNHQECNRWRSILIPKPENKLTQNTMP